MMSPIINVPYFSQWDDDAGSIRTDCGPACVKMLIAWNNGNVNLPTVNEISTKAGLTDPNQFSSLSDLSRAASSYGLDLVFVNDGTIDRVKAEIDAGRPVLSLIHYGALSERLDKHFTNGHFVVVVGYENGKIILNDPDWWEPARNKGNGFKVTEQEFTDAITNTSIDGNSPNLALFTVDQPAEYPPYPDLNDVDWDMAFMSAKADYANVRQHPTTSSPSIGAIYKDTLVKILRKEISTQHDGDWLPTRTGSNLSTAGWVRMDVVQIRDTDYPDWQNPNWTEVLLSSTVEWTNLREGPSLAYPIIGKITSGTPAMILREESVEDSGTWIPTRIGRNFNVAGWVREDVVVISP